MTVSRLDQLYRRLLLTKFFTRGWGKPDNLKRLFAFRKILSNRDTCQHLVAPDYPINIDSETRDGDCIILEGHFTSPFIHHLPGIMPKEVETASFQMILPLRWQHSSLKPVCIHLAGTGDHYFWRRRIFTARPLLKESGIASILLENPYYGTRKPKQQGVMSGAIPWKTLQEQFFENSVYQDEIRKLIVSPEEKFKHKAYDMGQQFVKEYSQEILHVESLHQQVSTEQKQATAPLGTSTSSRPGSVLPDTHSAVTNPATDQPLQHLQNFDKNNPSVNRVLGANINENQNVKDVKPTLTPEEYMTRVSSQQSFSEEQSVSMLSPSSNPAESILTAISTTPANAALNSVSTPAAIVTLHHQSKGALTSSSLQQHSVLSSSTVPIVDSSSSLADKRVKPSEAATKDSMQTLKSGKVKQSVLVSNVHPTAENDNLTLKDAVSKSRLLISQSPSSLPIREEQVKNLQLEALDFMRGVMDECTHLGNFSVPVDPELIIIVSAKQDGYVPKEGVIGLDQLWPGCEVRYVDQGHVGAVLFNQRVFRKAISDAFDRQIKKYYQVPHSEADVGHSLKS